MTVASAMAGAAGVRVRLELCKTLPSSFTIHHVRRSNCYIFLPSPHEYA